jgi:hypothetical protein
LKRRLSAGRDAGISEIVCRANVIPALLCGAILLSGILPVLGGGCDLQSLRGSQLFGGRDAAADGAAADAGIDIEPDAVVDAPDASTSSDAIDAIMDATMSTDATDGPAPIDTAPDVAAPGMLSGTVRDTCTHNGLDALVGIAGRHVCSYPQKGSYYFRAVPLGTLKLAAAKDGYALYEATIEIVPGGNIHDIDMVPATTGGCGALPSPPVACTCTTPTCEP